MNCVELTDKEKELLGRINLVSYENYKPESRNEVGDAVVALMKSLIRRKAIPAVRIKYFSDPEFNILGRGKSRVDILKQNGIRGEEIFKLSNFLKYLRYFLCGPDLPPHIIERFQRRVADLGTSSDIVQLGTFARQITRASRIDADYSAEEFFKLALECGLELYQSRSIRDSVKAIR